jgi:hypothetical protein
MDRLLTMDKERFIAQLEAEVRQVLGQVADAVNNAPDGHVINDSEMKVRELMAQLRQTVFQTALQMRIDSTESSFSPSEGRGGPQPTEQGALQPQHVERQRTAEPVPGSVVRRRPGK